MLRCRGSARGDGAHATRRGWRTPAPGARPRGGRAPAGRAAAGPAPSAAPAARAARSRSSARTPAPALAAINPPKSRDPQSCAGHDRSPTLRRPSKQLSPFLQTYFPLSDDITLNFWGYTRGLSSYCSCLCVVQGNKALKHAARQHGRTLQALAAARSQGPLALTLARSASTTSASCAIVTVNCRRVRPMKLILPSLP